ncbi:MAG: BTAD domain-containing putative transcriptional regulator, partial [Candidatus Limnocylindrales bacterium]
AARLEEPADRLDLEMGFSLAKATCEAIVDACLDRQDAAPRVREALSRSRAQHAWRFESRLAIIDAALAGDRTSLLAALDRAADLGNLALAETSDVIARHLHLLEDVPPSVEDSVRSYPQRWLASLRTALTHGNAASSRAAARLLARHGLATDVPRLVAFEQKHSRTRRVEGLSRTLARRVSPRLRIRDLGRVRYEIGDRIVPLTRTRRKAASLLVLLLTRQQHTATKDQVLEELWPDLNPTAASNSLNQTLFYLRRDIDEFYDETTSVDYVVFESELLWLDADMVQPDSARFYAGMSKAFESNASTSDRLRLLDLYAGKFAPEFEYEEWSIAWRDQLHASFLRLCRALTLELTARLDLDLASQVLRRVLAIDPRAMEFERDLIWVYSTLGAMAAAESQYAHYSASFEGEFGVSAPSISEIVRHPPA